MTEAKGSTTTDDTASKGAVGSDKVAAAGAAPVSDKKAADTADAYEKAAGLESEPAQDFDPVIDAINEAAEDIEQPKPQTGLINPGYEKQRAKAFEDRETDEDEDDEDDDATVPDADHAEVGSHLTQAEDADDDGDDKKPAAKKTAAKKS